MCSHTHTHMHTLGDKEDCWIGSLRLLLLLSISFVTAWTIAHQALLSVEFSRQEYWSGLPFPSPRDLPDPEIEPMPPALAGRLISQAPH